MRPDKADASLDAFKEVSHLADLFQGFYLLSCEDIGLRPVKTPDRADSLIQSAESFLSKLAKDNELKQDVRFMLPIQSLKSEEGRDSTSYWVVDGICTLQYQLMEYAVNPSIDFGAVDPGLFMVMKTGLTKKIATADFLEMTLPGTKTLNRDEFRKLANKANKNPEKIKGALEQWAHEKE